MPETAPARRVVVHRCRPPRPLRRRLQRGRLHAARPTAHARSVRSKASGIDGAGRRLRQRVIGGCPAGPSTADRFVRSYALYMFAGATLVVAPLMLVRLCGGEALVTTRALADGPVGPPADRCRARLVVFPPGCLHVAKMRRARRWLSRCCSSASGWPSGFDPRRRALPVRRITAVDTGFRYRLPTRLDGIALVLVLLTAALVPLLLTAGWNDGRDSDGCRRGMPDGWPRRAGTG